MHAEAWKWVEHSFRRTGGAAGSVVEIGSYDHNGTARTLFEPASTTYVGVDVIKGKGVDFIGNLSEPATLKKFVNKYGKFNTVISTETLEHTEPMPILKAMFSLLDTTADVCRVIITCANKKRAPHGHDGFEVKPGEYYAGVDDAELNVMLMFALKDLSITWDTHEVEIEIYWSNPISSQDTYAYVELRKKPPVVSVTSVDTEEDIQEVSDEL